MDLPIIKNLRQKRRKEIAKAQDLVVQEVYRMTQEAVLHGGTAIWRCYNGNRFSKDLDFYFPPELNSNLDQLEERLKEIGLEIGKLKTTENSLYATLYYNERTIKFGGLFKKSTETVTKQYSLVNGTNLVVNTLPPEELLKEKADAYLNRRKVRDLYDVYYLSDFIEDKDKVEEVVSDFLQGYQEPKDKGQLKSLIITGVAPSVEDILKELKRWSK